MDKQCMVSILCTAYNHEKYVANALDSFIAQETDFPFEVIVTDDASKDQTPSILAEYAEQYPDIIHYYHQETNLFSKGVDVLYKQELYPHVHGKYIALCEGDDYWINPKKLQLQVDFLESHPDYSACVHNTYYHYCETERSDKLLVPSAEDHDVPFETILHGLHRAFHTSSILAHSEYIMNHPDYEDTAASYGFTDYSIGLHLALEGKIRFLNKPMSVYRVSSNKDSWSSGYGHNYEKRTNFVRGEIAMMNVLLPHLKDEKQIALTKDEILAREYELLYLQGNVKQMIREPYRKLYRKEPLTFKAKTTLKLLFPTLHEKYRRKKGFGD